MTKVLLGSAVAVALIAGAGAQAADLAVKAPPALVSAVDWTGVYVGGHVGYAASNGRYLYTDDVSDPLADDLRFSPGAFLGGGQIGVQGQYDRWVVGIEATYSATNMKQSFVSAVVPNATRSIAVDGLVTATIRMGYSWDALHLYSKAGVAWAKTTAQAADLDQLIAMTDSKWRGGWTAGLGVEYLVWQNVVVGIEANYTSVSTDDTGIYNDGVTAFAISGSNVDIYSVVARASYLFH